MKKIYTLCALAAISLSVLSGCGNQASTSRAKDIGTDLSANGATYVYWLEGNDVVQGQCRVNAPVSRTSCNENRKSLPYAEVEAKVLTPANNNVATAQQNVNNWQQEFTAIDRRLRADPSNADLQAEWRHVKRQWDVAQEGLILAEKCRNDVLEALHLLKDQGVTYRVTSDNTRYDNVRPAVASFYYIFTGTPVPPTTPPSRVTWVDPVTGKSWAVVGDRMMWSDANAACQRNAGWRLPSSTQDFNSGDGSNLEVASRLFASPLGLSLMQLPYKPISGGSDYMAKVVWTSDYTPSSSYGALLYVYASIEGQGLDRYLHLLSSNSRYTAVCVKD